MTRDCWCTPEWLAIALARFDVDPCSNEHTKIWAGQSCVLEWGDNGLHYHEQPGSYFLGGREEYANSSTRAFINPPYSRGQVIRWVKHWLVSDFTFLLRWDPSTEWFKILTEETKLVWFPDKRLNFEPPPGVKASSNPYPHALFFRNEPANKIFDKLNQLGRFFKPREPGNK